MFFSLIHTDGGHSGGETASNAEEGKEKLTSTRSNRKPNDRTIKDTHTYTSG